MVRRCVALTLLAACGRIGFDGAAPDDAAGYWPLELSSAALAALGVR